MAWLSLFLRPPLGGESAGASGGVRRLARWPPVCSVCEGVPAAADSSAACAAAPQGPLPRPPRAAGGGGGASAAAAASAASAIASSSARCRRRSAPVNASVGEDGAGNDAASCAAAGSSPASAQPQFFKTRHVSFWCLEPSDEVKAHGDYYTTLEFLRHCTACTNRS